MKLIYAGTPEFAARALGALIRAGHDIAIVLTQPDRPAGRGQKLAASPVKALALAEGLHVAQPATLRDASIVEQLRSLGADAMVVAAYGLILPPPVLAVPSLGCINIHASLLPRWRGAAPIQRAILAGDPQTGISIMRMDAGLDTGPILIQEALPIADEDTAQTVHDNLAELGAQLIVRALADLPEPQPQSDAEATYAAKIDKREAVLDWHEDALVLHRKVRAYNPAPGAWTLLHGEALKIWSAQVDHHSGGEAGTILDAGSSGVLVACGRGALRITTLQRAGGKRLAASAFLSGTPLPAGTRLGV